LIYLTKGEFEFFKVLKERFLKRAAKYSREPKEDKKESSEKQVELRSLTKRKVLQQEIERPHRSQESIYWSWQRVKEHVRNMSYAERYEEIAKRIKT